MSEHAVLARKAIDRFFRPVARKIAGKIEKKGIAVLMGDSGSGKTASILPQVEEILARRGVIDGVKRFVPANPFKIRGFYQGFEEFAQYSPDRHERLAASVDDRDLLVLDERLGLYFVDSPDFLGTLRDRQVRLLMIHPQFANDPTNPEIAENRLSTKHDYRYPISGAGPFEPVVDIGRGTLPDDIFANYAEARLRDLLEETPDGSLKSDEAILFMVDRLAHLYPHRLEPLNEFFRNIRGYLRRGEFNGQNLHQFDYLAWEAPGFVREIEHNKRVVTWAERRHLLKHARAANPDMSRVGYKTLLAGNT